MAEGHSEIVKVKREHRDALSQTPTVCVEPIAAPDHTWPYRCVLNTYSPATVAPGPHDPGSLPSEQCRGSVLCQRPPLMSWIVAPRRGKSPGR